ncbi:glycosyltransferase, partial [Pseudoalteromonas sp. APC 3694]
SATEVNTLVESISYSQEADFRIVLIHNATADEAELLAIPMQFPAIEFHIVINKKNLGYAGGNNAGYDYLKKNNLEGDLVIINPDVTVSKNTLAELQSAAAEKKVALVMCRTLDTNGSHLYDFIQLKGFINNYKKTEKDIVQTDYAAGSCLYVKRTVVGRYGLFDASFFMYWEEVDLSMRYKQLGYRSISTTKTIIERAPNSSERSANALYYSLTNARKIKKKYFLKGYYKYIFMLYISSVKSDFKSFRTSQQRAFFKSLFNSLRN